MQINRYMCNAIFKLVFLLLVFTGLAACDQEKDQKKSPDEPPIIVPPIPDDTDHSKPGGYGKFGVDISDNSEIIIIKDFPTPALFPDGWISIELTDYDNWVKKKKLKKCPKAPIYITDSTEAKVKKCARVTNYSKLCKATEKRAKEQVNNAIRSCRMVPSCDGLVVDSGQYWDCYHSDEMVHSVNGQTITFPEINVKKCSTQYKVVCLSN